MATLTELVAAVVLQSSAAAFSHFGVTIDRPEAAPAHAAAADHRVVARSPRRGEPGGPLAKASACPDGQVRGGLTKA